MQYSGFTLLELSIVLVIIGLITGGVIAGQELIHQAELNAVVQDTQQYKVAINTFKLKYDQLPGDMTNATDYWPSCGTTADVNTSEAGCNGNGSGLVNLLTSSGNGGEGTRSWQHLSLAEIMPGNYPGELDAANDMIPGITVPSGPIDGTGYELRSTVLPDGSLIGRIFGKSGNLIEFSAASGTYHLSDPSLSTQDAQAIDRKADDGIPSSGSIYARRSGGNCTDVIHTGSGPAIYEVSLEGKICDLVFWLD